MGRILNFVARIFIYTPDEFADIIGRHQQMCEELDVEELPLKGADTEKFIRTLETIAQEYSEMSSESDNPMWFGHEVPAFMNQTIKKVRRGSPVDWGELSYPVRWISR